MSTRLGNGNITFGDGTVQSTATPTIVSAFTNDGVYLTPSDVAATYAAKTQTVGSFAIVQLGYSMTLYLDDINGNHIGGGFFNCNCNC